MATPATTQQTKGAVRRLCEAASSNGDRHFEGTRTLRTYLEWLMLVLGPTVVAFIASDNASPLPPRATDATFIGPGQ